MFIAVLFLVTPDLMQSQPVEPVLMQEPYAQPPACFCGGGHPDGAVVQLNYDLDEIGKPRNVIVEWSDPPGYMDQQAIQAFESSKWLPRYENGQPIETLDQKFRMMFECEGDRQTPLLKHYVAPKMPIHACLRGSQLTGTVDLTFDILASGEVENVQVIASDPEGYFERQAINTVSQWLYDPPTKDGSPVGLIEHTVTVTYDASLCATRH